MVWSSFEKRLRTRPRGVVSKKDLGARSTRHSTSVWMNASLDLLSFQNLLAFQMATVTPKTSLTTIRQLSRCRRSLRHLVRRGGQLPPVSYQHQGATKCADGILSIRFHHLLMLMKGMRTGAP